ncbi:uncharacterized protein THITE_2115931 [Thermothielavioides terrestris NRRL 8126]|uniref:CFEM domain-containing protein n=1 Tax=Thermothielavioides terrestris (strain ATCC 38088 / NRRL 8126) TaxID=578455 RepID=G2QYX5_THETT|nr:uncharacterized protein THITE_2115931 [Thermothielavioides terrestris NRRL 8126]AEO67114.1 hypothetical protein THITE_2115931 [Thermothielavioides terrestris NRRL 8126]
MKAPAVLAALSLAGAAVAQLDQLPSCAKSCADKFLQGGIGNCGTDPKCICSDKSFLGSIACCLAGVCDPPSQSSAVSVAISLCSAFQVTDLPTAVSCSTTAPASTTTGAPATTTTGSSTPTATGSVSPATNAPSTSTNFGPRATAAAGLGALGGFVAAVAML